MKISFGLFISLTCLLVLCALNVTMYYEWHVTQAIDSLDLARSELVMRDRCGEESPPQGRAWALLAAGSNGFENYFDQADVYRTYHLLRDGGLEDDRIVVLHYDDIASDEINKFPGEVRQAFDGPDFYAGVPKDYTGDAVTAENVFNVLTGNSMAGRKVIQSTSEDTIFVFITGHGSEEGVIHMPDDGVIYSEDLIDTLLFMHAEKIFKSMVIYIEACFSGCLFEPDVLQDKNIFVVTSCNCAEKSWSANSVPFTKIVNGKVETKYYSLTMMFSCLWLRDSENYDRRKRSVGEQYEEVKKKLVSIPFYAQHAMEFGTKGLKAQKLCKYMGYSKKGVAKKKVTDECH